MTAATGVAQVTATALTQQVHAGTIGSRISLFNARSVGRLDHAVHREFRRFAGHCVHAFDGAGESRSIDCARSVVVRVRVHRRRVPKRGFDSRRGVERRRGGDRNRGASTRSAVLRTWPPRRLRRKSLVLCRSPVNERASRSIDQFPRSAHQRDHGATHAAAAPAARFVRDNLSAGAGTTGGSMPAAATTTTAHSRS